ncbi:conserved oligomeric Golgi complex subunit 5 [Dorcoceras hygrometricum]|uniref:Conserved oligomeric Golgi complex subunit 5 n=1 Tax=Dorcoceras hygrometricum TaxID=472368 RepID=A0A2Z7CQK0_9LAMI|nr:conserved oligomeric Golgi complex subunit 5 [Dorcoceras hygrometricum]
MDGTVGTAWTWGWSTRRGSGQWRLEHGVQMGITAAGRGCVLAEHDEPLGSLGLNGAGDDPADEYIPIGGEDL